jgi:hypothetical protein
MESLLAVLVLGQGDIGAGNYRDIGEFFAELASDNRVA